MGARKNYHSKRIGQKRYVALAVSCIEVGKYCGIEGGFKSVVDLGSSCGPLLAELAEKGKFKEMVGVDCSKSAEDLWVPKDSAEFVLQDLNEEFDLGKKFDLIICLEVAEHVANGDNLIKSINNHSHDSTVLILSAAPPSQPAKGHVNLKPHYDWINDFREAGWYYFHNATTIFAYLLGKFNQMDKRSVPKYYLNSMVFTKQYPYGEEGE